MSNETSARTYGVVPLDTMRSMSGLAFLEAIRDGRLPAPPIAETLGFGLSEVSKGRVVFAGTPSMRHYNPLGSVHGGYAATLLDSCMGCAVQSTLEQGFGYTTLEIKISYVRAMTDETGAVLAEGRVIGGGRRAAFVESWLRDGAGRGLAHGTSTCLVFPL